MDFNLSTVGSRLHMHSTPMLCHACHALVHTTTLCSGVRTAAAEGSNDEDRALRKVRSGDNLSTSGPRGGEVFASWGEGLTARGEGLTARGEGLMVLDRGERVRTLLGSTILWKLFTAAMETCGRKKLL